MKYSKISAFILLTAITSFAAIFPAKAKQINTSQTEGLSLTLPTIVDMPQGIYEIASAVSPSFVLDVRYCTAQHTDSKTLQIYRSLDVNQQKFYLEELSAIDCRLSAAHSGDALTVSEDGISVKMAAVEHNEKTASGKTQSWQIKNAGEGAFYLRAQSGMYLTMDTLSAFNGASVRLKEFTGGAEQKWLLNGTELSSETFADTDLINPYDEDGEYSNIRLAIKFDSGYEVLPASRLAEHMIETDEHTLALDQEFLSAYVNELAQKYDTQGIPRQFRTSHGTEATLYEGNFGWKLDTEATKAALQNALALSVSKAVAPVWAHKGIDSEDAGDIGNSYVEIDLTNQKVWLYKEGELLLETDCVSGTPGTDRQTPGGIYSVYYMQSPDILNGPDYESYVEYWIAFNGNIGLHDANWRNEFGGGIYKSNGSHGCINLPTDAAKLIYETVSYGYPVICY